jgi:transcriptional regulator with XRE-family HTH domain
MTTQKVSTFRERFRTLCSENPSSDSRLAEQLHVSKQTISAWKSGARSPKDPTISAIAQFFNVNVKWLMGFDVPRDPGIEIRQFTSRGIPRFQVDADPIADAFRAGTKKVEGTLYGMEGSVVQVETDIQKKLVLFHALGKMAKKDPETAGEVLAELYDNNFI